MFAAKYFPYLVKEIKEHYKIDFEYNPSEHVEEPDENSLEYRAALAAMRHISSDKRLYVKRGLSLEEICSSGRYDLISSALEKGRRTPLTSDVILNWLVRKNWVRLVERLEFGRIQHPFLLNCRTVDMLMVVLTKVDVGTKSILYIEGDAKLDVILYLINNTDIKFEICASMKQTMEEYFHICVNHHKTLRRPMAVNKFWWKEMSSERKRFVFDNMNEITEGIMAECGISN
jgi:hypothetical protein